jgi:hypothetical protein
MERIRNIDSWEFEWNEDIQGYECRGPLTYNDDHDEVADNSLWKAAERLRQQLQDDGYVAELNYSEKGWVEVEIV